jgi:hypothetical protein
MTTVSTVKNITVAYNPNDFYYMNAKNSEGKPANNATAATDNIYENQKAYCITKKNTDINGNINTDIYGNINTDINGNINGNINYIKCEISNGGLKVNGTTIAKDNNNYGNYLSNCYDKALCINEDNEKKINNLQLKHDGADERHGDINIYYNRELLKTYNLGIGIVGVGIMIYFFYK